jgi:hypothetical protein
MKTALPVLRRTNRPFILLAALAQFVLAPSAHSGTTECTEAFNRVTALMNQGEASMCRNPQQVASALDAAAVACAGVIPTDFGAAKSDFLANARRCPTQGGAQGGSVGSERSAPAAGNAALNRARAEGDRAEQFLKDMDKCDQISDPGPRSTCRFATTRAYQGGGSGTGASANSRNGGGSSASSGPDGNPDQRPKALPPPKDPGVDYSGQACSYFTRPAVEVEARLNYHAKGSCVTYGNSAYECGDDGRWLRRGAAAVFKCKTAEELETSKFNANVLQPGG